MESTEQIKVAFLVSGGGTNLQAIIDASAKGELPNAVFSLVVSNKPGVFALERAKKHGIPTAILDQEPWDGMEKVLRCLFTTHQIDVIVLAGFLKVLPEGLVREYENRILNIHPSLIPAFSGKGFYGLKVHEEALKRGVKLTGATVHFVNEIVDGGKILMQKAVEILEDDTPERLQQRVMNEAEWIILPKALQMVCAEIAAERRQK